MRIVFVDANEALGAVADRLARPDWPLTVNRQPDITPDALPALLQGAGVAIIDHTHLPAAIAARCPDLRHVIFLGTGPRSYMDPEALQRDHGITTHIIKGYGDVAVAEFAIALLWAAAKSIPLMDRQMRAGSWLRSGGMQLAGKTLGLIGFGAIAAEVARRAHGAGMRVIAWNRTPRSAEGVSFLSFDAVLAQADALSLHLLLTDETRGILNAAALARMKPGAILINTARGALVDESAMIDALRSGRLRAAGLDVFETEPMPADHPLLSLPNVVLTAHSAFRTPEANDNLIAAAFDHYRRIRGDL